jgi:hypothetical protein
MFPVRIFIINVMRLQCTSWSRGGARRILFSCFLVGCLSTASLAVSDSPMPQPMNVGLRTGFSATHLKEMFYQTEALAFWPLPLSVGEQTGWYVDSGMEFSAGWLTTGTTHAAVSTMGVGLELTKGALPLRVTGGTGMTLLSRYQFEKESFGTPLQFTSHLGLTWDTGHRFRVGYRFQHMSNARLAKPNPGLDLHAFTLSCQF